MLHVFEEIHRTPVDLLENYQFQLFQMNVMKDWLLRVRVWKYMTYPSVCHLCEERKMRSAHDYRRRWSSGNTKHTRHEGGVSHATLSLAGTDRVRGPSESQWSKIVEHQRSRQCQSGTVARKSRFFEASYRWIFKMDITRKILNHYKNW